MCDACGRKQALLIATTISLVGSALQAGSAAIGMFLFARWLTGYGVGKYLLKLAACAQELVTSICNDADTLCSGNLVTLIPIMQAEISPPASRGFLVGQHGRIASLVYARVFFLTKRRLCSCGRLHVCRLGRLRLLFFGKFRFSMAISTVRRVLLAVDGPGCLPLDSRVPSMA